MTDRTPSRHPALFWGLLLAAGLLLRAGYAWHVYTHDISKVNMDEYETIARQLVAHGRYDFQPGAPTAAREPGFPIFIAAVYLISGVRPFAVLLCQCILGAATAWLLGLLARRLAGERARLIATVLMLAYPYSIFYSGFFYRETLFCFLLSAALLLLLRFLDEPGSAAALGAGLAAGVCAATYSSWLLITAALAAWVTLILLRRRTRLAVLAVYLAAWGILPAAWTLRNYAVFGNFIPASTLGGFNLYTALIVPEQYRGTQREMEFELADPHWKRIQDMLPYHMFDDGRQQAAFLQAAKQRILARPGEYLTHVGRQVVKLWRFYPYPRQYQHSYGLIKTVSLLSDGWLIPLGLLGLALYWRRSPDVRLYALVLLLGTLCYGLTSAILRYRLPLMLPLIITSSALLAEAWERHNPGNPGT